MKKKILALLLGAYLLSVCASTLADTATRLRLTDAATTLYVGMTMQLDVTPSPAGSELPPLAYSSSHEQVASVDEHGLITGLKRGSTVITVASADNPRIKATHTLSVRTKPTAITLSAKNPVVTTGHSIKIHATLEPSQPDSRRLVWSTDNAELATVDQAGNVTGHQAGAVTITAASKVDPSVFGTLEITVGQLARSISFEQKTLSVISGEQLRLGLSGDAQADAHYAISPDSTSFTGVTFKSSHPKVASVDENGVITGLSGGKTTITATTADGSRRNATVTVEVIQPVQGVSLVKDEVRIGVDRYAHLEAVFTPKSATNTNMTWTTSDPAIATVTGTGPKPKVVAHAWGECVITGTTQDGGYSVSALIHGGSYNYAIKIRSVRLKDGKPSLVFANASNETITEIRYRIRAFDQYDNPIEVSNSSHPSELSGVYTHSLAPGESTQHGRFSFQHHNGTLNGNSAWLIDRIEVTITGLTTESGLTYHIKESRWNWVKNK